MKSHGQNQNSISFFCRNPSGAEAGALTAVRVRGNLQNFAILQILQLFFAKFSNFANLEPAGRASGASSRTSPAACPFDRNVAWAPPAAQPRIQPAYVRALENLNLKFEISNLLFAAQGSFASSQQHCKEWSRAARSLASHWSASAGRWRPWYLSQKRSKNLFLESFIRISEHLTIIHCNFRIRNARTDRCGRLLKVPGITSKSFVDVPKKWPFKNTPP